MTEIDGFRDVKNVVVIGASNRAKCIDNALLRSGRFDTKIKVNLPDMIERAGILKIHLNDVITYYFLLFFL